MTEQTKCFCDRYRACAADPERQESVGYNAIEDHEVFMSGRQFVEVADITCPGTTVILAQAALNAQNVVVEETAVTISLPREAVNLQCEYFGNSW